jgi:cytoskeletal protein CcmA (bactofilin family)
MLNIRKSAEAPSIGSPTPPPLNAAQPASISPAQQSWQLGGRPGDRVAPSIIGSDLTVMGNLVSRGEVHVEGEIQGDIHGTNVVVGEKAKITGAIIADEVVVRGHVMGSIRGKKVMLQSTSHVEGDVFHQALAIEQGAFFEGKSRRAEDPTAGIARPEVPDFGARATEMASPVTPPAFPES